MNVRRCMLILILVGCLSAAAQDQGGARIVFFGDSITELGVKPRGYVTLIRNYFKKAGSDVQIIGAGVSGNRVPDLLKRVDRDVLSRKPAIVVVYIGINDVWHFTMKNLHGTPKEEFRQGLNNLVSRIQKSGGQVVLCTPTVIGEKRHGENPLDGMLDQYSEIIRSVVEEQGVALCDLRKIFITFESEYNSDNVEKGLLTYDGVHLSDEGNRIVADTLIKLLEAQ